MYQSIKAVKMLMLVVATNCDCNKQVFDRLHVDDRSNECLHFLYPDRVRWEDLPQ